MEIVTRAEAIERGLKRYFTGRPCKHGHIAERFVKGCLCYGCTDANAKRWIAQNKPRKDAVDAAYRAEHREALRDKANARYAGNVAYRETIKSQARAWGKENPDRAQARWNEWVAANPERRAEHNRTWRRANLGAVAFWSAMRRATVRKATPMWADAGAIQAVYERAAELTEATGVPHEVDHFYPLRSRLVCGLHVHENLQVLTEFENRSKGNKMPNGATPMDQVKLVTIEPHDGHVPGELYTTTERTAAKLIARRLAKMAVPVQNKMALPHANKANPSLAAGEVQPSSASPVAQPHTR